MSNISPQGEQSTSSEIRELAALNNLAPAPGQAVSKTGPATFVNIPVGSIAVEIPSGVVNGSNLSFTVVNLPLYIEVSGQVMVSQTTDPTNYGYTISGSSPLYTITFVNPPMSGQTPHSFHV